MENIGIIASIIAAITGIVAMITSIKAIRNSKGNVIKQIETRQRKIQELNNWFARTYGLNDDMSRHYDILVKREKLESEIEELQKKI